MEGQEIRYNNARIRVHLPDRSKEEQTEKVKKATEDFLKQVMLSGGLKQKGAQNNGT